MSLKSEFTTKEYWKVYGPAIALAIVALVLAWMWMGPPPPKSFKLAAGGQGGAYYAFAQRYAAEMAKHGIEVEIIETAGSTENLGLLTAPVTRDGTTTTAEGPYADIALVQSGMSADPPEEGLASLASLYVEPIWVFHRVEPAPTMLSELRGRRVATGAAGSGTEALARRLLAVNGVTASTATLESMSGQAAVDALRAGELDALVMVTSASHALVRELVADPAVTLLSVHRSEAYVRRFRFLRAVTLPEGILDFENNHPGETHQLIGPTATLVARDDFHPALVDLMLQAAKAVHAPGDTFADPGAYPSPHGVDYPLSPDAVRYFEHGPPFLQRFLPFWWATTIDRLKVMLLPLIVLLIPLFKILPPAFHWRTRRKIIRWYKRLQAIDQELEGDSRTVPDSELVEEIEQIEHEVCGISVPLGYADQLYNLRLHVALMRDKIRRKSDGGAGVTMLNTAD